MECKRDVYDIVFVVEDETILQLYDNLLLGIRWLIIEIISYLNMDQSRVGFAIVGSRQKLVIPLDG